MEENYSQMKKIAEKAKGKCTKDVENVEKISYNVGKEQDRKKCKDISRRKSE